MRTFPAMHIKHWMAYHSSFSSPILLINKKRAQQPAAAARHWHRADASGSSRQKRRDSHTPLVACVQAADLLYETIILL